MIALDIAIRILSARSYSENEIRERLSTHGFDLEAINTTVSYLTDRGYLNDMDLCQSLVTKLQKSNKYSIRAIAAKLKQRGLKPDIIQDCLCQIEPQSELSIAMRLVKARYKNLSITDYAKVARFLANRGFSNTTTSRIMEQLFSDT